MPNQSDTKNLLEKHYQEYKKNKFNMTNDTKKMVCTLLVKRSGEEDVTHDEIIQELSRMPADLTGMYFDKLMLIGTDAEQLEQLFNKLTNCKTDSKKKSTQCSRYAGAVTAVLKGGESDIAKMKILVPLVDKIAENAANSTKSLAIFQKLIENTGGRIFLLDYSKQSENNLKNIWNVTKQLYPDLSAAKYESFITEWAAKYGFLSAPDAEKHSEPETKSAALPEQPEQKPELPEPQPAEESVQPEEPKSALQEKPVSIPQVQPAPDLTPVIEAEGASIREAVRSEISALQETIMGMRQDFSEALLLKAENARLLERIRNLEEALAAEQRKNIQISTSAAMNTSEKESLTAKIEELDQKLREAYSLNSRADSLEAEKLRMELSKSFAFCYEQWNEYESAEYSEENYESLQAIIRRMFRTAENNGIDLKGNKK